MNQTAGGHMAQNETIGQADYKRLYEGLLAQSAEQKSLLGTLRRENHRLRLREVPLPNAGFEYLTNLQYRAKDLAAQVSGFKSGERYVKIQADHNDHLAIKNREISRLKRELASANRQVVDVRNIWVQVIDDLEKEHTKELLGKDREIDELKKKLLETQIALDAEKDKFRDKAKELYEIKTELEEEKEKVQKLKAQINRDHENSSKPSSSNPNRKKIANNREASGKRPGGQPGHKGHPRKRHTPTGSIGIPPPEEFENSPDYQPTGRIITKQLVDIRVEIIVTEYSTPEFRHLPTRNRVHADFPEGVVNDVNYSGNIKAFAFLLNNRCNVSIVKTSDFLSELTGGELKVSTGMICGLAKEFSKKTEDEQKKAFADLLLSPVMNTDITTARVNGKNMNVVVCATPTTVMYFAREHKGHAGVKGTPVEDYQHTLVHDHDITFYSYGGSHGECNDHPLRYLKGVMENEPGLEWSGQMRELIREMIHFRNGLDPDDDRDPDQIDPGRVRELEAKYDEILGVAKKEYEYEPPSKYNMDGFNLYARLEKYKANHLLFLHDRNVPHGNNLSERLLRVIKRKVAQVMAFRSFGGLDYLCQSLGTVATLCAQGSNLYESAAEIFSRRSSRDGINTS